MNQKKEIEINSALFKQCFTEFCKLSYEEDRVYCVTYYDKPVIALSKNPPEDETLVGIRVNPTYCRQNWGHVFNAVIEFGIYIEVNLVTDEFVYMYKKKSYTNKVYEDTLKAWKMNFPLENKEIMYSHPIVILKKYTDSVSEIRNETKTIEALKKTLHELVTSNKGKEGINTISEISFRLENILNNIAKLEDFSKFLHAKENRKDININPEMIKFSLDQKRTRQ